SPVFLSSRSPSVALLERREIRHTPILARRIIAVTEQRPHEHQGLVWGGVSAAITCAVIATAFLIQRPGDWSHDRLMLSTVVNLERMAHRNIGQTGVSAWSSSIFVPLDR
ncbi:peptidase M56, BlaR1, partial [Rhodobacteraceae bacterium R_SAG4]|nr:peptidase M56, BlaR1 [Rhodobacteraceae bacterium R_SAG4]